MGTYSGTGHGGRWGSTGRRRRAPRTAALLVAALVAVGATGACARGGSDDEAASRSEAGDASTSAGAGGATAAMATGAPVGADGAVSVADTDALAGAPLPEGLGSPRVVRTATIEVEVAEGGFDAAFSKVPTIAAGLGGFVASSTSSYAGRDGGHGRHAAGSLVVRVPADQFDAARRQFVELGRLRSQELAGDDVGGRLTDLEARLRNLGAQEEAIRLLMAKTKTIGETIEVQRQLGAVREQIEQLSGEQARLADAVALSTLTLSLAEPGASSAEPAGNGLGAALRRAIDGAETVLAGTIVGLGYAVPLGLLVGLAWLLLRPVVGRRERPLPAPTTS